ncbi:hypothetical protein BS47DRAFT_1296004 [Hydnum rufescens UP504]|uniref:DUF1751-domain-containing protein n=1 Tax=Hydnum rufescens UP504 TaxID=1448309 RepID=A0A9P6DWE8_9AGAM|nr:hypothetical protein BS47DRAFT_1296004 [Hydnum rufescens UP504]
MAMLNSPLQFVTSIPPAARAFTILLVVSSLLRNLLAVYSPGKQAYLDLVPGLTLWHPWTLITSAFVEVTIVEMALSIVILPISLRYVERLWGAVETTKFVLITVGVSNVIAVFVNIIEHIAIGQDGYFLFGMAYNGLMALQVGVLVALTQAIPEHQILLFGALGVRIKRLPMLYVTFSNIMCILGYQSPYILIQFGWLVSWVYLRFYKRTGGDVIGASETWGDRSETFAFVNWFPPLLHKPVSILSDVVYKSCTRAGLVKAYGQEEFETSTYGNGAYVHLPGGARAEAERRRAMALKALDQRLASSSASTVNVPSSPSTNSPKSPPTSQANATSISTSSSAPGVSGGASSGAVERQTPDGET